MRRHVARLLLAIVLGTVPIALGVATALTATGAGRALLARELSVRLGRLLRGRFEVGAISGSFLHSLTFDRLVVRDTSGALLASLPRAEVTYRLHNLLAGRLVLNNVRLYRPVVHLLKHASGRLNYEEVLRLGEGPPGGPSRLVEFRDVLVTDGILRVSLPWSPPDTVTTEAGLASALAADRARPGRIVEETPDGLRKVVIFDPLTVQFRTLRITTPDRLPLSFDITHLTTKLNDPGISLVDLAARGWTKGDSLAFSVSHGAMANTDFAGGGVVTWPRGVKLYDFVFDLPRLDLTDLRWVSPDFPAMTGRVLVAAHSETARRTAYALRGLSLRQGNASVDGELTALTDRRRGLGVRDMNLHLVDLDLDAVRPYLDTLPLHGTLTGNASGSGFLDSMDLDLAWAFRDARVETQPVSQVSLAGHVVLSGPEGFVFDTADLRSSDIDLRTVRLLAPAVILDGRLSAVGILDGPWRNATFEGSAEHRDGERPVSALRGRVRLDTRDTLGLYSDVELEPLAFDGVRPSFPALRSRGILRGRVRTAGTLNHLEIDADLRGEIGSVKARGYATFLPPRWGADSLRLTFSGLNLAELRGTGPSTSLTGWLLTSGVRDSSAAPVGSLELELGHGSVREFRFDTVSARVAVRDSLIHLDTLVLGWRAGGLAGAGDLGWSAGRDGSLRLTAAADSLIPLDTLVTVLTGVPRDTSKTDQPLGGAAAAEFTLSGSLDSLRTDLDFAVRDLVWRRVRSPLVEGSLGWAGGARPLVSGWLTSDSITAGESSFLRLRGEARGWSDSLAWSGGIEPGGGARIGGGGRWWRRGAAPVLAVDSLTAGLSAHQWRLGRPVEIELGDSALSLTPLLLEAEDGSGSIQLEGRVPRLGRGDLTIAVLGLDLKDVYAMLQRDTAEVAGSVALDLNVGGTGGAPTIRGTGSLNDARFGEFNAPYVQGVIDYGDRRLEANLLLWKTGVEVLQVEAVLPLDLALRRVAKRQVAGPLSVRARADSTALGILEAFTPSVRRVQGSLAVDAQVSGTWDDPRLSGFVTVSDGAASVPGLGVRFTDLNGRARLTGDSIALDALSLTSGNGTLRVSGGLRLERLTRPLLNLHLRADQFRAIDVRNFLTLEATGRLSLTGPVFNATLTGRATAHSGALHFADLITKRIVDLENPGDTGLIDLALVHRQNLGAGFQNRFLDSLRVADLRIDMGESFWLRSSEANIQLDGTVSVDKARQDYRLDGTLNALRGTYALKIGFVTRDFVVERGTVRYFGTPDLNAELDIQARHTVHTVQGNEDIPIIAKIGGTLLDPRLSLESTQRPPLSETELVSYLMFGKPSFSLSSGTSPQGTDQLAAVQTAVSYLSSALSSELQRTLISDLGIPIDYIEIRPGQVAAGGPATPGGASQVAQLAAGWQIGRKWFVTLNADVCTNLTRLYPNVEFRISGEWRLKTSAEPTQSCSALRQGESLSLYNKYQIGFDLLWDREQ